MWQQCSPTGCSSGTAVATADAAKGSTPPYPSSRAVSGAGGDEGAATGADGREGRVPSEARVGREEDASMRGFGGARVEGCFGEEEKARCCQISAGVMEDREVGGFGKRWRGRSDGRRAGEIRWYARGNMAW